MRWFIFWGCCSSVYICYINLKHLKIIAFFFLLIQVQNYLNYYNSLNNSLYPKQLTVSVFETLLSWFTQDGTPKKCVNTTEKIKYIIGMLLFKIYLVSSYIKNKFIGMQKTIPLWSSDFSLAYSGKAKHKKLKAQSTDSLFNRLRM